MKVVCSRPAAAAATPGRDRGGGGPRRAALTRRAAGKAALPGDPVELGPAPTRRARGDAVGTLLELLGDAAFNGLAHAEGRGALGGSLGERVAAPR